MQRAKHLGLAVVEIAFVIGHRAGVVETHDAHGQDEGGDERERKA